MERRLHTFALPLSFCHSCPPVISRAFCVGFLGARERERERRRLVHQGTALAATLASDPPFVPSIQSSRLISILFRLLLLESLCECMQVLMRSPLGLLSRLSPLVSLSKADTKRRWRRRFPQVL